MKQRLNTLLKALFWVYSGYTICRILFYFIYKLEFNNVSVLELFKAFLVGALMDTVIISYANLPLVLLLFCPFSKPFSQKWTSIFAIIFMAINLIIVSFNLIDLGYFQFTHHRTGDEIFKLVSFNSINTIFAYVKDFYLIIIVFVVFSVFLILRTKSLFKVLEGSFIKPDFKHFSYYILIIAVWIVLMRGGFFRTPLLSSDAGKFVNAELISLTINTPHHIISTFQTEELEPHNFMSEKQAHGFINTTIKYQNTNFEKKNVVVFILESFDKEYIGYYNEGKGYTPFFDSIIASGISFKHSYANGVRSIEAPPAIFSSIPSLMRDSYINSQYVTNKLSGLGEILAKEGYETAFYHGGENGTMNFDTFIGNSNFGKYYGKTEYPKIADGDGYWGIPDDKYLDYFANELAQSKQPFCKSVFTLSSHHPYVVPEEFQKILPKGTLDIHQSIAYTDLCLRNFFTKAKKMPWFKNTIFVFTADHTSVTERADRHSYFWEYCVPIVFWGEGLKANEIVDRTVQHKDILPTVLYLLGYNKPFFSLGANMFGDRNNNFSITLTDSRYWFCQYPNIVVTDFKDYVVKNDATGVELEGAKRDSLINKVKAYVQIYENDMLRNRLYLQTKPQ